jgi:solute carrier family 25 protein 33/36
MNVLSSRSVRNNGTQSFLTHLIFLARFLVARTRLREQAVDGVFKYKGMWQSLAVIAREEGRQGLYSGMGVHLMKTVPNSAFMFLTYEIVRKWLGEFTIVD